MKPTFSIREAYKFGWTQFRQHWKFWLVAFLITYAAGLGGWGGSEQKQNKSTQFVPQKISTIARPLAYTLPAVLGEGTVQDALKPAGTLPTPDSGSGLKPTLLLAPILFMILLTPYLILMTIGIIFLLLLKVLVDGTLQMGFTHLCISTARGNSLDYKLILSDVSIKKAIRFFLLNLVLTIMVFLGFLLLIIPGIYLSLTYSMAPYLLIDKNLGIGDSLAQSAELTKGVKLKLLGFYLRGVLIAFLGILVFMVGIIPAIIVITLATAYVYATLEKQHSANVTTVSNPATV